MTRTEELKAAYERAEVALAAERLKVARLREIITTANAMIEKFKLDQASSFLDKDCPGATDR